MPTARRRALQDWTSTVICVSGLVYILSCTRWLLNPSLLGMLLVFCAGCCLAVVLCVLTLVLVLYKATDTYDPLKEREARLAELAATVAAASHAALAAGHSGKPGKAAHGGKQPRNAKGKQPALEPVASTVVVADGRLQLGPGGELPAPASVPLTVIRPQPAASDATTYSGVIWTVPASTWSPEQTPTSFPPACEGPDAISHRWFASLADGTLRLKPAYGAAWPARPMFPGLPLPALPPLVVIPLTGCEARVVTECFSGPRVWGKRGPLEVKVVEEEIDEEGMLRQLLYGETSFYFFAETSQAKEQWLLALQASCGPPERGAAIAAARATYAAMCAALIDGPAAALVTLPRASPAAADAGSAAVTGSGTEARTDSAAGDAGGPGGRQQKRPGGQQNQQGQQQRGGRVVGAVGAAFGWVGRAFGRRGQNKNQQQAKGGGQNSASESGQAAKTGSQGEGQEGTRAGEAVRASLSRKGSAVSVGRRPSGAVQLSASDVQLSTSGAQLEGTPAVGSADSSSDQQRPGDSEQPDFAGQSDADVSAAQAGAVAGAEDISEQDDDGGMGEHDGDMLGPLPGSSPLVPSTPTRQQVARRSSGGATAAMAPARKLTRTNSSSVPDLRALGTAMGVTDAQEPGDMEVAGAADRRGAVVSQSQPTGMGDSGAEGSPLFVSPRGAHSNRCVGRHSLDESSLGVHSLSRGRLARKASIVPLPGEDTDALDAATEGTHAGFGDAEHPSARAEGVGAEAGQGAGVGASAGQQPGWAEGRPVLGAAVDGIHGLNMLLVRLGYEMLRSSFFPNWLQRMLQRLLDLLKRPPYLQPLTLDSLDLGPAVPLVKGVRAVAGPANASPGAGLWPQLALDVVYAGRITASVSTKIELQKAGFITSLQTALTRLQGGAAGDGGVAGASPAAGNTPAGTPRGSTSSGSFAKVVPNPAHAPPHHANSAPDLGSRQPDSPSHHLDAQVSPDPSHHQHTGSASSGGNGGGGFLGLGALRRKAAATAQHLTSHWVDSLSRMPVQLIIEVTQFEGTVMLFLSPPPSDRLWISFLDPPRITLTARPVLNGRSLRFGGPLLGRVSALLQSKIIRAIHRELVFPSCLDLRLGFCASADRLGRQRPLDLPLSLITSMPAAATPFPDLVLECLGAELPAPAAATSSNLGPDSSGAHQATHHMHHSSSGSGMGAGGSGSGSVGGHGASGSVGGPGGRSTGDSGVRLSTGHLQGLASPVLPRPGGGTDTRGSAGVPTPPGSVAGDVPTSTGKAGPQQRRGLTLGFRWRPWGRRTQDAGPGLSRLSDVSGGTAALAGEAVAVATGSTDTDAATTFTPEAATGSGVVQEGPGALVGAGTPEEPSMQGATSGPPSEAGSAGAASLSGRQRAGRIAATVAGHSIKGLAWLGGNVARGFTRNRQPRPSPFAEPTDLQALPSSPSADDTHERDDTLSDLRATHRPSHDAPHSPAAHALSFSKSFLSSFSTLPSQLPSEVLNVPPTTEDTLASEGTQPSRTPAALSVDALRALEPAGRSKSLSAAETTHQPGSPRGGHRLARPQLATLSVADAHLAPHHNLASHVSSPSSPLAARVPGLAASSAPQHALLLSPVTSPRAAHAVPAGDLSEVEVLRHRAARFSLSGDAGASPSLVPLPCGSLRRRERLSQDAADLVLTDVATPVELLPARQHLDRTTSERLTQRLLNSPLVASNSERVGGPQFRSQTMARGGGLERLATFRAPTLGTVAEHWRSARDNTSGTEGQHQGGHVQLRESRKGGAQEQLQHRDSGEVGDRLAAGVVEQVLHGLVQGDSDDEGLSEVRLG